MAEDRVSIGIFLSASPEQGGTFQYNLSILAAFAALPRQQYRLIAAYTDPCWQHIIANYQLDSIHVPLGLVSRIAALVWRVSGLPMSLWRRVPGRLLPAARKLRNQECKLWIFPSQDCWSYQFDLPALVSILDLMHRYESRFPEVSAWGRSRILDRHYRHICRWARGVLVDSMTGKCHVHESYGISHQRIHVLPFIPPGYIYENRIVVDEGERFAIPGKYIFYPAQFWAHKNHIRLLHAVALVKERIPDIHLVLTGSKKNAYVGVLKEIDRLGLQSQVTLLGYVPDVYLAGLYKRARALVMPTFFGPTNIPPLEAMALGCPVAISNSYGMPEQVGDAALLFDPESVTEMADCIFRLWSDDDLCAELIEKGKVRDAAWGEANFMDTFSLIVARSLAS